MLFRFERSVMFTNSLKKAPTMKKSPANSLFPVFASMLSAVAILGSVANLSGQTAPISELQGSAPTTAYLRLDPTFNGLGVRTDGLGWSYPEDMVIQPDGKIVGLGTVNGTAGGDRNFSLVRYNADGSPDTSFDGDGRVVTSIGTRDVAAAIAVQADGKIVAVGESDSAFVVLRYNVDGSLDNTFDGDGKMTISFLTSNHATAVGIMANGKIVVAGGAGTPSIGRWAVARLNADGTLDNSFSDDGKVVTSTGSNNTGNSSLDIQPDRRIVVVGDNGSSSQFVVARYNSDGTMDGSFDGDGLAYTSFTGFADEAAAVKVQADGKIVVAGNSFSRGLLARYNTDGSLDTSFGVGGKVITNYPTSTTTEFFAMAMRPNGKILTVGKSNLINGDLTYPQNPNRTSFVVAQYNSDGSLDRSFDLDGRATLNLDVGLPSGYSITFSDFIAVAVDSQDRIVAFGYTNWSSPTVLRAKLGPEVPRTAAFDDSGDGLADLSVFRPSNSTWYKQTHLGFSSEQFGQAGDKPVPADFDGDGKVDLAIFRPSNSTWYLIGSATQAFNLVTWGQSGDVPVATDMTGDGRADFALFRPSTNRWYIRTIDFVDVREDFGSSGDVPVAGDFDGDGASDLAVYNTNTHIWRFRNSSVAKPDYPWGETGDILAPADYDGDGATDIAVWRPSTGKWWIIGSTEGWITQWTWGVPGDTPVPADYDGDGRADIAIWRPSNGTWYYVRSSDYGIIIRQFGQTGDIPNQSAFTY